MPLRIVFTGGGTLGSVTPLLAVADELRRGRPDAEFLWIGTADGPEAALVREAGLPFRAVSAGKFRRAWDWRNFTDLYRIAQGFFQALPVLGRFRADAVVTAGGFVAVPVVWAAWLRRIPIHVHQLDLRPGLANRLSAPFARSLTVSFERSLHDYRRPRPVWTGTPIRRLALSGSAEEGRKLFGLRAGHPVILVTGGGTGAAGLNALVRAAAPLLCAANDILHLTGRGKAEPRPDAPAGYHQVEFITDAMRHAYAAADLVVTRAGIGALTELAALGKPSVIVPLPGTHQEENAVFFAEAGGAMVLNERRISAEFFAERLIGLLHDPARLAAMGKDMKSLDRPDAAAAVAARILGLVRRRNAQTSALQPPTPRP